MKDKETFDIPGYKFGLLIVDDYSSFMLESNGNEYQEIRDMLNRTFTSSDVKIVSFDYVDGLTMEEVKKTLGIKGPLIMICYTNYEIFGRGLREKKMNVLHSFVLSKEEIASKLEQPVDFVIEKKLEDFYQTSPDDVKRMIRCFFERYQDKSHKDTVERIQKINIRK